MENSFLSTPEEVLKHFGVTEKTGLSHDKVLKSRAKHGANGKLLFLSFLSGTLRRAELTASSNSSYRGSPHAGMETYPGTVQRSACSDPPRLGGCIVRSCAF